ncbi:MAG: zf-HC2 domain-containing protein [Acidobacteria bacterium]|nr:zf-HC2 domain-containing protein [Acidobacteriota bacterium]
MEHATHNHGLECKEIFELLSAYIDAELPEDACAEIQAHIAACEPCVEFVKSLRRTVELCHGYATGEQPAPLSGEARQRLMAAYRAMAAARGGGKTPCPPRS